MSGRSDAASFEKGAEGVASDAALMARVQAGDRKAFAEIVDRYKDRVLNYLTRLTGCRDRAEDLGQETFLRVFRSADRYEERGQLAALIFRIATNLVRTEERRERRARFFSFDFEKKDERTTPSPQGDVLRDEALGRLSSAVAELPMHYRVPLVLHEVEGWTVPRIAEALECREGTIKSRISRGRQRLRETLAPYWNGGVA